MRRGGGESWRKRFSAASWQQRNVTKAYRFSWRNRRRRSGGGGGGVAERRPAGEEIMWLSGHRNGDQLVSYENQW